MSEPGPPRDPATDEGELRKAAVERIESRRGLQAHGLAFVLVNGFLVTVWALTGAGFFWPLFPLFGWGIGLAFHVWGFYSPSPSEASIQAEMRRLRGD